MAQERTTRELSFFIDGVPVPKGSMRKKYGRIVHDNERLSAWMLEAQLKARRVRPFDGPWDCPCSLELIFYMPLSGQTAHPGGLHFVKPDLDKLTRTINDVLEKERFIANDSRVCDLCVKKRWKTSKTGVFVVLRRLDGEHVTEEENVSEASFSREKGLL